MPTQDSPFQSPIKQSNSNTASKLIHAPLLKLNRAPARSPALLCLPLSSPPITFSQRRFNEYVSFMRSRMRFRSGFRTLDVETLHPCRLRRQRHLAGRHGRGIRRSPTRLSLDISRLRDRPPQPPVPTSRRLQAKSRLGRQACGLRTNPRPCAAVLNLHRSR